MHDRAADETAIREHFAEAEAASNAHDPARTAATYTPDGEIWIFDGRRVRGSDQLRRHFETAHGMPGERVRLTVDTIRFVSADVALVEGTSNATHDAGGARAHANLVVVRRDAGWKIAIAHVMSIEQLR